MFSQKFLAFLHSFMYSKAAPEGKEISQLYRPEKDNCRLCKLPLSDGQKIFF